MSEQHHPVGSDVCDESDPRSWKYRREHCRPRISWGKLALIMSLNIVLPLILYIALTQVLLHQIALLTCIATLLIIWIVHLKIIVIFIIKIYQNIAPLSLRNKCRFEPSCSQYMIICLEKYGLIKGLEKGIRRLKKCTHAGGGYDIP